MNSTSAPDKPTLPFAHAGGKNAIPVPSQVGITAGAASLTDGFPPLTRTPIAAGGVPPSGLDMNGILFEATALGRWYALGSGFVFDGTFAEDANIEGYPKGARVMRSDGSGYWLNTIDGNTVDPESVTPGAAATAGWVPDATGGTAAIAMTSSNVTLTPAQYGKPIIVISGTLTSDLNLIFPSIAGSWIIENNCTGMYTATCKTAAGTGVAVNSGQRIYIFGDATNIYSTGVSAAQIQAQSFTHALDTGLANAYAIATTPAISAPVDGMELSFTAVHANTGASTLAVNSGTAYPILDIAQLALTGAEIPEGARLRVRWNSTLSSWVLISVTGKKLIPCKFGSFTRYTGAGNGNQAITGIGFKPKKGMFFSVLYAPGPGALATSTGIADGVTMSASYTQVAGFGTGSAGSANSVIEIGGSGWEYSAALASFDADGFTVSWTTIGSPPAGTITILYLVEQN